MKHSGILKPHILSPKGLHCSLKMEHLPSDVFHLHSKNSITRSSVLFDMGFRNPAVNEAEKSHYFQHSGLAVVVEHYFWKLHFPPSAKIFL